MSRSEEITEHLNRLEEGTKLLQRRAIRLVKLLDARDPYDYARAATYLRSAMFHQSEVLQYLESARVSFTMGEDLRPMSSWERKKRDGAAMERGASTTPQGHTPDGKVQGRLFSG